MSRRDPNDPRSHQRTEPTLGNLDQLQAPAAGKPPADDLPSLTLSADQRREGLRDVERPARESARPRKRGWLWPLTLLVVIGLGTTAWLHQDQLRNLVPRTELNDVLSRADQALAAGHLDGNDGTSARELYEAARALEPDNDRARDGLIKVGQAEVAQAEQALNAGQLDQAGQDLDNARELLGGGADVDRLSQALATARGGGTHTSTLVDQAQAALAAGKLDGNDGAGALYQQVLAAEPGNAVAAHGLDQVGDALAGKAHQALDANDATTAQALIGQLAGLLPNYGELPTLRARLGQLQKQSDDALDDLLQQGQTAMHDGRFTGAGQDTALYYFKAVLARDPDNAQARSGLGQVAQALIVQANAALDGDDTAQAAKLLDQAAELAPKSAELAAARARLQGVAKGGATTTAASSDDARDPATVSPPLSPQQQAQLAQLVQQAQAAAARGDIMLPPGDSAYDLYRSALAIDGNNPQAVAGMQQLPQKVTGLFKQALRQGDLFRAGDLLGTLADLSPGDGAVDALRQQLANAWLDQSARQLAQGDRFNAQQSWAQARKLDPANPRLQNLAAQLQGPR